MSAMRHRSGELVGRGVSMVLGDSRAGVGERPNERRGERRHALEARVTVMFVERGVGAGRVGVMGLEVRDAGAHGLGAVAQTGLGVGARVMIAATDGPLAPGAYVVVRCRGEGRDGASGYALGLRRTL